MEEHLTFVLQEMCSRVSADFDSIDFKQSNWYTQYEWFVEEEAEFTEWLADYVYRNKDARRELTTRYYRITKRDAREFAKQFVWNYGWKNKKVVTLIS